MPKEYAHALYVSLSQSPKEEHGRILDAFLKHLDRTGKKKALTQILRELNRLAQQEVARADTFKIARKHDVHLVEKIATFRKETSPIVITDDTLIGGYVYKSGSTRIDASYKRALVTLYRSITHH